MDLVQRVHIKGPASAAEEVDELAKLFVNINFILGGMFRSGGIGAKRAVPHISTSLDDNLILIIRFIPRQYSQLRGFYGLIPLDLDHRFR